MGEKSFIDGAAGTTGLKISSRINGRSDIELITIDEKHPRYVKAWKAAADDLLKTGKPFEINMGAMANGIMLSPYPRNDILCYLKEHGAKFILANDAHKKENIAYMFDEIKL